MPSIRDFERRCRTLGFGRLEVPLYDLVDGTCCWAPRRPRESLAVVEVCWAPDSNLRKVCRQARIPFVGVIAEVESSDAFWQVKDFVDHQQQRAGRWIHVHCSTPCSSGSVQAVFRLRDLNWKWWCLERYHCGYHQGLDVVPLLGAIAGRHSTVLWLGGRPTLGEWTWCHCWVPLHAANLCFISSFEIQGHQFHPDTQKNNNEFFLTFLQRLHCFLPWEHKNWFLLSGVYAGIIYVFVVVRRGWCFVFVVQRPISHLLWRFKVLTGKKPMPSVPQICGGNIFYIVSCVTKQSGRQRYWLAKTLLCLTLNEIPSLGPHTNGKCMWLWLPGNPTCWCHVFVQRVQSSHSQKTGEQNKNAPIDVKWSGVIHLICGVLAFLLLSQQIGKIIAQVSYVSYGFSEKTVVSVNCIGCDLVAGTNTMKRASVCDPTAANWSQKT